MVPQEVLAKRFENPVWSKGSAMKICPVVAAEEPLRD
jgi:hypothetical protein